MRLRTPSPASHPPWITDQYPNNLGGLPGAVYVFRQWLCVTVLAAVTIYLQLFSFRCPASLTEGLTL